MNWGSAATAALANDGRYELRSELPCSNAILLRRVPRLAGNAGLHDERLVPRPRLMPASDSYRGRD